MIGLVVAVLTSSSPRARERPFTLVVMPDVQYYTDLRHKLFRLYWDPPTDNLTHIYTRNSYNGCSRRGTGSTPGP